ncbi:hypothetical protein AB835_06210 [Candidatus Endobugula sertula]|uniref:Cobalamin biosynthesis protein CobD n=1 Tax=Candidatus Endobugula sertula TaxID=62101 RepID=A0A1D2QQR2_9GAMM|nr:hypothetical protein AB835_06210 [Candidatus Endobugula sertula]
MFNDPLVTAYSVLLAVLLDIVLGEPKRCHPLVGFGYLAMFFERCFNRQCIRGSFIKGHSIRDKPYLSKCLSFFVGFWGWLLLVIVPTLLLVIVVTLVERVLSVSWWIEAIVLYFVIAYNSLRQHALAIMEPLQQANVVDARTQLAKIVSRDTAELEENGVCKAAIESVLENGSDAIFAPIFWFLVGGLPAVLIYRFSNTLDAMWGYKTERFLFFGRFAARMDDVLNWFPSRLVGVSYAILGKTTSAFDCWQQQAKLLKSPSAGVVMSSGAGSLQVRLGGDTIYHGETIPKPEFGCGEEPVSHDIQRSLRLVGLTLLLWCTLIVINAVVTTDWVS